MPDHRATTRHAAPETARPAVAGTSGTLPPAYRDLSALAVAGLRVAFATDRSELARTLIALRRAANRYMAHVE